MPDTILDPRVHLIVTLRKRGNSEDEITALTSLFDALKKEQQDLLSTLITQEDPEIVRALVQIVPEVHTALVKGKTSVVEIIEQAAKPFLNA